jgi:hypothetical protein
MMCRETYRSQALMVKTTFDCLESIQKENGLDDRLRLALGAGYFRIAAIQGDPLKPSLGDVKVSPSTVGPKKL